jgi:hypothetical protein
MKAIKQEVTRTANAVLETIASKPEPVSAGDIAKEFSLPSGRHKEIAYALKHLIKRDKIVKIGEGRKSRYITTNAHLKPPLTETEVLEQAHLPVQPPSAPVKRARALPVAMVEVPRATLKMLVKACMESCSPMDNALQRAVLQCMEKLI